MHHPETTGLQKQAEFLRKEEPHNMGLFDLIENLPPVHVQKGIVHPDGLRENIEIRPGIA